LQLLYQETHPAFAASAEAVTCPRLLPRTCQMPPALAFTRASAEHYDVSAERGAVLRSLRRSSFGNWRAAVCAGHVMAAGRHAAEFTIVDQCTVPVMVGLARPGVNPQQDSIFKSNDFWGWHSDGRCVHNGVVDAPPERPYKQGDVIEMLLDCDAGTLTIRKKEQATGMKNLGWEKIGVAVAGLAGEFCWMASICGMVSDCGTIRIEASDAAAF
jgi:hypothetical protein